MRIQSRTPSLAIRARELASTPPRISTLDISVPVRIWTKGGARYAGEAVEPDLPVTESSIDHFAGRDPVLEAALTLPLESHR